ncbi:MAG: FmdB family zinc ribbon protein [Verrucomicrobiota bacterium]
MPIYEYQCQKCGAVLEVLIRKKNEKSALLCKKCKGTKFKKIFSTISVVKQDKNQYCCEGRDEGICSSCCGGGGCPLN